MSAASVEQLILVKDLHIFDKNVKSGIYKTLRCEKVKITNKMAKTHVQSLKLTEITNGLKIIGLENGKSHLMVRHLRMILN